MTDLKDFLFELNGLIDNNFVHVKTDSKEVLLRIIEMMDSIEYIKRVNKND